MLPFVVAVVVVIIIIITYKKRYSKIPFIFIFFTLE